MSHHFPARVLLALGTLAVLLTGCGKTSGKVTGPTGDNGGEHLLAFVTDRNDPGNPDVALYDLDQAGFRTVGSLNSTAAESEPCISDDGNYLAFASNRGSGAGGYDVYVWDRLQGSLIATPGLNTAANESHPRFTYDSVRLAFVRDSAALGRIRLYEPVGDTLIRLPGIDSPGGGSDEAPSPDLHGDRIAFQSNRSGTWHVYVWDRGSGVLNLPDLVGDSSDVEPSLSSDGRWLAFASNRSGGAGGYDVYEYDLASHAFVHTPRLDTPQDDRHPSVSGGGSLIALETFAPGSSTQAQLYVYTAGDSTRKQPAGLGSTGSDQQPYLRWR